MDEFNKMLKLLTSLIPDGTKQELEIDGVKYIFNKDGENIKIEVSESFDDTSTKEIVAEYKEGIKKLDDDLFVEVTEELSTKLNLKEFNELLDLESFNEEQADKVEEMISISSDIIGLHLQDKIQDMVELYKYFTL